MALAEQSTLVGVFDDRSQAQQAVAELRRAGFGEDQLGVLAKGEPAQPGVSAELESGTKAEEGAVIGAAAGAGAGALWALGIAAGVLPALGPAIAGGTLMAVLASAAGTAVMGGIWGALAGLGIPEDEARYYAEEFRSGRTLVTVRADGRYDEARAILVGHSGRVEMQAYSAAGRSE